MILVLFGRTAEPWVTPVVADIQAAGDAQGGEIAALSLEAALRARREWQSVRKLYVLPFEVPAALPEDLPLDGPHLLHALFPRAEIVNPPGAHNLCWDKIATAQRLNERGVAMPETLITMDPDEARDFVRRHGQAILKEPRACGGQGHVVLFADDRGTIAGEVPGRRYVVELAVSGVGRTLRHGVLTCPPPFYLQRLVTGLGRGGVLTAAQILRAYVVDGQIAFWAERRRDKIRRPADFIISAALGARYHFLRTVSDAAATMARRAAEALGMRIGVVDLIRAGDEGPFVLEADTDGEHMLIDRSFKRLPEFRDLFDLDRLIAEALLAPIEEPRTRVLPAEPRERRPRPLRPGPLRPARPGGGRERRPRR